MIERDLFEIFSSIDNFIIEKNHCKTFIAKIIIGHLKALKTQFRKCFTLNIDFKKLYWIQKLFLIGLNKILIICHIHLKRNLAELSNGLNLKI